MPEPRKRYYLPILTATAGVLLFAALVVNGVPGTEAFLPPLLERLVQAMVLLCLGVAFITNTPLQNPSYQRSFLSLIAGGAIVVMLFSVKLGFGDPKLTYFIESAAILATMCFIFFAIKTLKPFTLLRQRQSIKHFWKGAAALFAIALIIQITNAPHWVLLVFYGASGAVVFPLATRLNWIAFLPSADKLRLLIFSALGVLVLAAVNQFYFFADATADLGFGLPKAAPLGLSMLFLNTYALITLCAVLFNLPLADVIDQRNKQMETFREITKETDHEKTKDDILLMLLRSARENTRSNAAWLYYHDMDTGEEVLKQEANGISKDDLTRILNTFQYNRDQFQIKNGHLYVRNFKKHPLLRNHLLDFQSMAIFNLPLNNNTQAKVFLVKQEPEGYDEFELELVETYVQQAKLSLNNSSMIREALEKERHKKDVEIGKSLQKRLLPEEFPENDVLDIGAASIAAEEVGGDYYDYRQISRHKFAFIVADVSGKGTAAAFHVAEMKGIFQSLILSKITPSQFLTKANKAVSNCFDKGMFITLIFMIVDTKRNTIQYTRAGHCPILHYNFQGKIINYLEDEGLGLGIIRNDSYAQLVTDNEIHFSRGDVIMVYTDGIVEARNDETDEEYGYERLKEAMRKSSHKSSQEIVNDTLRNVRQFARHQLDRDDLSLLVLKVK